jgi:hypothetical protein
MLKTWAKPFVWLNQFFCKHPSSCEKTVVISRKLVVTCGVCGKVID